MEIPYNLNALWGRKNLFKTSTLLLLSGLLTFLLVPSAGWSQHSQADEEADAAYIIPLTSNTAEPSEQPAASSNPAQDSATMPDASTDEPASRAEPKAAPTAAPQAQAVAQTTAQSPSTAQDLDFANLSLNDLLTQDLTVSTSGKTAQKLSTVPEAMWVLTGEEIRRSGATNIAEVLRLVPGMDVIQLTPGHYEVCARFHETMLANNLLLLIDSRPMYVNFFKTNVWMGLPVVLEEIERIEVVLGPGSTLYGTNAIMGIVNIITRTPDKDELRLRLAGGPQFNSSNATYDNGYASALWSKKWGELSTRLAASYVRHSAWDKQVYPGVREYFVPTQSATATAVAQWQPSPANALTLRLGGNHLDSDYIPFYRTPFTLGTYYADLQYTHHELLMDGDRFETRAVWRGNQLDMSLVIDPGIAPAPFDVNEQSSTLLAMYRFPLFDMFTTTVGLEGELQNFSSPFLQPGVNDLQFLSFFLQEKIQLTEQLIISGGVRLMEHFLPEEARFLVVPKGSIVFSPAPHHVLRLSGGQAFYNPSLLEAYGDVRVENGTLGVMLGDPSVVHGVSTQVDAGYQYTQPKLYTVKLDIFYNRLSENINIMPNPSPESLYIFHNEADIIETFGGEVGVSFTPHKRLGLKAAYALAINERLPYTDNVPGAPFHKGYFSLHSDPIDELKIDLSLYIMSFFAADSPVSDTQIVNPIELLNLRVAYRIIPELDIVLSGYNLLGIEWGSTFRDGAIDTESQVPGAGLIGRRIMLGIEAQL